MTYKNNIKKVSRIRSGITKKYNKKYVLKRANITKKINRYKNNKVKTLIYHPSTVKNIESQSGGWGWKSKLKCFLKFGEKKKICKFNSFIAEINQFDASIKENEESYRIQTENFERRAKEKAQHETDYIINYRNEIITKIYKDDSQLSPAENTIIARKNQNSLHLFTEKFRELNNIIAGIDNAIAADIPAFNRLHKKYIKNADKYNEILTEYTNMSPFTTTVRELRKDYDAINKSVNKKGLTETDKQKIINYEKYKTDYDSIVAFDTTQIQERRKKQSEIQDLLQKANAFIKLFGTFKGTEKTHTGTLNDNSAKIRCDKSGILCEWTTNYTKFATLLNGIAKSSNINKELMEKNEKQALACVMSINSVYTDYKTNPNAKALLDFYEDIKSLLNILTSCDTYIKKLKEEFYKQTPASRTVLDYNSLTAGFSQLDVKINIYAKIFNPSVYMANVNQSGGSKSKKKSSSKQKTDATIADIRAIINNININDIINENNLNWYIYLDNILKTQIKFDSIVYNYIKITLTNIEKQFTEDDEDSAELYDLVIYIIREIVKNILNKEFTKEKQRIEELIKNTPINIENNNYYQKEITEYLDQIKTLLNTPASAAAAVPAVPAAAPAAAAAAAATVPRVLTQKQTELQHKILELQNLINAHNKTLKQIQPNDDKFVQKLQKQLANMLKFLNHQYYSIIDGGNNYFTEECDDYIDQILLFTDTHIDEKEIINNAKKLIKLTYNISSYIKILEKIAETKQQDGTTNIPINLVETVFHEKYAEIEPIVEKIKLGKNVESTINTILDTIINLSIPTIAQNAGINIQPIPAGAAAAAAAAAVPGAAAAAAAAAAVPGAAPGVAPGVAPGAATAATAAATATAVAAATATIAGAQITQPQKANLKLLQDQIMRFNAIDAAQYGKQKTTILNAYGELHKNFTEMTGDNNDTPKKIADNLHTMTQLLLNLRYIESKIVNITVKKDDTINLPLSSWVIIQPTANKDAGTGAAALPEYARQFEESMRQISTNVIPVISTKANAEDLRILSNKILGLTDVYKRAEASAIRADIKNIQLLSNLDNIKAIIENIKATYANTAISTAPCAILTLFKDTVLGNERTKEIADAIDNAIVFYDAVNKCKGHHGQQRQGQQHGKKSHRKKQYP